MFFVKFFVFFGLFLSFFYSYAQAAIDGWSYNNNCYSTAQGAVDVFVSSYVASDSSNYVTINTPPTVAPLVVLGSGFSYSTAATRRAYATALTSAVTVTHVFKPCDSGGRLSAEDSLSMIWIGLACCVYGLGMACGLLR